ncbi:radical SAM protein [Pseudomonas fluorescens]|uniref:radical SAM protein n=1 Tax=Pseudomonas TaxID=286 RepID=UPI00177D0435|nr:MULTISPECIES: radical SAM protein [Pseudomonas]MBD8088751.1 radical SAM protein [Pseudomonas fluorescens]MBD8614788.1 radical SAM protein [Pseudomonas putida]MBD8681528.1 radical SAM protein [Pseudomonas sp. CFBP 13719]
MNRPVTILKSQIDQSVNFTYPSKTVGTLEARFVRRQEDYFITYLSSQSGCDQSCRFCHLTTTGQVKLDNATLEDFLEQAKLVLDYYDSQKPAKLVHYNFMARGEPLNNPLVRYDSATLLNALRGLADQRELETKFLISSIFPKALDNLSLPEMFPEVHPEIYYSIYSMKPEFRRRWLAKAHSAERGLEMLKEWQEFSGKVPKIHFAFIEGQNDSEEDMHLIADAVNALDLKVSLNIVRYNPYDHRYGKEPDESVVIRNADLLSSLIKAPAMKVVSKVGMDVKASCGMFVGPQA